MKHEEVDKNYWHCRSRCGNRTGIGSKIVKKLFFTISASFIACLLTGCLSMLLGTSDSSSTTGKRKATEIVYTEIPYADLEKSLASVNKAGHGFIVDAYDIQWGGSSFRFSGTPGGNPSGWFENHDGGYEDTTFYNYVEPHQFERYNAQTYKRIDNSKPHKVYIGVYQESFRNSWVAFIDKIDGLMSPEEADAYQARQKVEREAAEAKAKSDREKALDDKAKLFANGYTYHGAAENGQSSKLFNSGALEDGHAYYISGFMIAGGGLTGAAITSLFGNPTYHVIEYASQKVKGEVVGASQTIIGTSPVTVVVAGGKPPLYRPVILGLVE